MAAEYYTYVDIRFGKINYRGYKVVDGKRLRVHGKLDFKPTIYLETEDESNYKSMYGKNVRPKQFESISEYREFHKQYGSMMAAYGYAPNRVQYEFIARAFPEKITYLLNDIEAMGLDIETRVGVNGPPGVPDPFAAVEEITHIALENHRTGDTVSLSTVKTTFDEKDGVPYLFFKSESELLEGFVNHVITEDPDIIYGFYADYFDYPYLINRIRNILGQEWVNKLSPFGRVEEREYQEGTRRVVDIEIVGRTLLDIQTLYKKIVLKKEEAYSLDNLAKVNLGVGKLENPCETFKEFSELPEHKDRFAEYNVIDTQRMTQLDKRMGLLSISVTLAYLMKCNFMDTKSPVKYWESYIMAVLLNEDRFVPIKESRNSRTAIPGAYVEEPVPGFYQWLISIDAAALYPSIMKALNLSPETFMGMVEGVTVEGQLAGKTLADYGVEGNFTLAANGAKFRTDFIGIVPRLVDDVLDGRKLAKKEMLVQKQIYVDTKSDESKRLVDFNSVLEKALKVSANAFFGVFLQPGFMFYDPRLGEAITLTGQYIILKIKEGCNQKFGEFFKTENHVYSVYLDTDSYFFTLDNIVNKYWSGKSDNEITDALDKLFESKLRPIVEQITDEIAKTQNHLKKTIIFKRESICSSGFWIGKKRYALKVYNNEGVAYPDGDHKIMGIEVVRSSTPQIARDLLKKCVIHVIDRDIEAMRKIVDEARKTFQTAPLEDIAFPRSANNLEEYSHKDSIYVKGTPIAVRGALLYNHYIKKLELEGLYDLIYDSDKLKFIYLKEPNPIRENVIAFLGELPKEFKLHDLIDRDTQFEKVFMAPLQNIMTAVGWTLEEVSDLESFFG